jgi:hypothetical protein
MNAKPATLGAGLIMVKKGEAAPAVAAPVPELEVGEGVTVESVPAPVATKAQRAVPAPVVEQGGQSYWKALTLKLDRERFTALKKRGVDLNKTSQVILTEALDLWLKKNS